MCGLTAASVAAWPVAPTPGITVGTGFSRLRAGLHGSITSLSVLQERLKPLGKAMEGFAYLPERPNATSFVEQKWGYSGLHIGELELVGDQEARRPAAPAQSA